MPQSKETIVVEVERPSIVIESEGLNQVLAHYKEAILPIKTSSIGDKMIAPTFRKKMKEDLLKGLIVDLLKTISSDNAELVQNSDGLMIVAQNNDEGFYTIQFDFKIKNIDYDPW